eukprot:gnl/TRDRNA2_/TRDRNA2_162239_c1_seq4.p1 gnl/TRDRNA2_/TRDRNA2_162239_c1~~gnl/TRDRNA2_/TRDRNA2_162239_c1_seq4.p1  ORF type:complete len:300 (+),score=30.48 gnl/TRDRNA2_/TRDRNA2_162239_c1_seq4:67-966(+)
MGRVKLLATAGAGCFFFIGGIVGIVVGIVLPTTYGPMVDLSKERIQQGTGGRCQVYDSSKYGTNYYTVPVAPASVEGRCANLQQCKCEKTSPEEYCKRPRLEDWENKLFDGDHGLKVGQLRWPTDSIEQDASVHDGILGAAVECPCSNPPAEVLGEYGAKPHADGSALIVPSDGSALANFSWPKGSSGCTLVHWFRGGQEGTTQGLWSSKIIGPKSHDHMSLNDWVEAGELDCVAVAAQGDWTNDDLYVNFNREGAIEGLTKWQNLVQMYLIFLTGAGVVALLISCSCCFCAMKARGEP